MGKNVLIVGGVAAGTKAAARARRVDPSLNITLITDEPFISYGGCGLPYYIGGVIKEKSQLFAFTPETFAERNKVNVLVRHRAIQLDTKNKILRAQNLNDQSQVKFNYDYLLIATGARPIRPPLPGIGLKNIFTLRNPDDADAIIKAIKSPGVRRVVVVGGGLIGLETVENLLLHGLEVRVVELLNQLLPPLDEDFAWLVEKHLAEQGVAISKSDGVKAFEPAGGDDRVGIVITEHNRFPADVVILSIGAKPNVALAETGGIEIGETGAIKVDPTMRTNYPDVFAAGDCVESYHLVTGKPTYAALGSVANRQGRVAGSNLAGLNTEFPGVVGTMIAKVCELTVARTGLNEKETQRAGINYVRVVLQSSDRAGYYPGRQRMWIKLLAERESRRLIGAQIVGSAGVDKRIDVMATALSAGMKIEDIINLDLAYSPPYSSALDPLNVCGQVLENIISAKTSTLSVMEVNELLRSEPENITIVDIRQPVDTARTGIIPGAIHIPLNELKERAPKELSSDKRIIVYDNDGSQTARACRILKQAGFRRCAGMDGGVALWPYELS